MHETQPPDIYNVLTSEPLTALPEAQLAVFQNLDSIHAVAVGEFALAGMSAINQSHRGQRGLAFECGGNSVRGGEFVVAETGEVQTHLPGGYYQRLQSVNGQGYLAQMEAFAAYARQHDLPVGMAYGGPLDGTKPLYHPKINLLMDELDQKYDGDFANVFAGLPFSVMNDSPAGLVSGAVEAAKKQPDPIVFYLINGGGLGLGVYKDGQLFSTEAGHVPVVAELNPYNVERTCGVYGDYVCAENIISNKQGLEKMWLAQTGEPLNGREIEDRFRAGDQLAKDMYLLTARLQACLIVGAAKVFDVDIHDPRVEIVVHGGANKTPSLAARTDLEARGAEMPPKTVIDTNSYHENACELGIAEVVVSRLTK